MIFVNNISQLEYYSANPTWGCYGDALFVPNDMVLQANGFTATGVTVQIFVCDTAGNFIEDGTSCFTWNYRSIVIGGVTYYYLNIKGDTFSPYMESNKCFTLNVIVTDTATGATVFSKWTQKYLIVTPTAIVIPPTALMDGAPLELCVPAPNPANCASTAAGFVKFSTRFDCYDTFTGDIYAQGEVISSYGALFDFEKFSHIDARFRDVPTDINITTSINCRTQKTSITEQMLLTGNVVFPVWKMKEIQRMMLGVEKYIDNVSYQTEPQTIFTQFGKPYNCQYVYKLSAKFNSCFKWQVFGCVPDCDSLAAYYLIGRPFARVYDDSMSLVATDVDTLMIYFSSIPDAVPEELSFITPCSKEALIKVTGPAVLPKFLYLDAPIPAQRVYPKLLPINTLDFSPLCNGVTNINQVPVPDITGENDEEIVVPVPDITGENDVSADIFVLSLTPANDFNTYGNSGGATSNAGEVNINIGLVTSSLTSPFVNEHIATVSVHGWPSQTMMLTDTDNGNLPQGSVLIINTDGTLMYSGPSTNQVGSDYYIELYNLKYLL